MEKVLVPSLPASSWIELETLLDSLRGVSAGFQVDIVDGQFAGAYSWPFTEEAPFPSEILKLAKYSEDYELEIDCMVEEPVLYLDDAVAVGAKRIIVHFGSADNWQPIFDHHQEHGYQLGLAFTNDIPLEKVESLLPYFDFVQVMGIAKVGKQGQPFDERTLDTVATLRAAYPELEIAVDGSVNKFTIPSLLKAGVNRFAPGSAIAKAEDPVVVYKQLKQMIQ